MASVKVNTKEYMERLRLFQDVRNVTKGATAFMAQECAVGESMAPIIVGMKNGKLVSVDDNPLVAHIYKEKYMPDYEQMNYIFSIPPEEFDKWISESGVAGLRNWVTEWLSDYQPDGYLFSSESSGYKKRDGDSHKDVVRDYEEGKFEYSYQQIVCVGSVWGLAMGKKARIGLEVAPVFDAIETRALGEWEMATGMFGQIGQAFYVPQWLNGDNLAPAKTPVYYYSKTFDRDFISEVTY